VIVARRRSAIAADCNLVASATFSDSAETVAAASFTSAEYHDPCLAQIIARCFAANAYSGWNSLTIWQ
jgi:hypothetical protein